MSISPSWFLSLSFSLFFSSSCLCLHSLLCPTFECNLFSLRSASLLVYTGKVRRISRHSPYIYIYICCRRGILANSEGESWPSSPSRCRTEHFVRGNPGQIQWRQNQGLLCPGFPPLGDQIPLNDFLSRKRLVQQLANCPETTIFIVVSRNSGPLSAPPPESPTRPHPDMFTIICLF